METWIGIHGLHLYYMGKMKATRFREDSLFSTGSF